MAFNLESGYVLLDGNEFETLKETSTGRHYFAERIAVRGEINFGLVKKDEEKIVMLSVAQINTPIIIDSIVAFDTDGTSDELMFNLYRENVDTGDGQRRRVLVGKQRYSNNQMPVDFPDGIIYPDMTLGCIPMKADSTVVIYCKPVKVAFQINANNLLSSNFVVEESNGEA